MKSKFNVLVLLVSILAVTCFSYADSKKDRFGMRRDPFVPLVDPAGNVKPAEALFKPVDAELPINISLKGILWGQKQPIAVINDSVFKEGDKIAEGLTIKKINSDSVILTYYEKEIVVELRKKERK